MKHRRIISLVFAILIPVALLVTLAVRSGIFDKDPVVEITADNCYGKTLHVITDQDYSPYSFYDQNNQYSGHDVELIALIANKLHMNLDLKFMSWNEGIAATVAGEAQVLMTCDYSDSFSGTEYLIKTDPISTDDFIVYSKNKISSVNELISKRIAVMENGNVLSHIETMKLSRCCVYYPDNRLAMQAVMDGEVDCAIMRNAVGTTLLRELGLKGIKGYVTVGRSYMCFGVNSDYPELVERINLALDKIKASGELQELSDKWLTTFVSPYTLSEIIANNIWLILGFLALLFIFSFIFYEVEERKFRAEEERNRYIKIIENLANDFECVNYVEVKKGKVNPSAALIRISDTLMRIIPEWASERNFGNRLKIMCEGIVAPDDRNRFIEDTKFEAVSRNVSKDHSYFVNFKAIIDNEPQFFQMKFSGVYDDSDDTLIGYVCGVHNIDAQTKAELKAKEQLKEAKTQLEAANKSKTDFLFNMSHDIRTPMNAIIGFTGLAKQHIDSKERVKDCLDKIDISSGHLLDLINEVLDMSRVEAGKLKSEMKTVDITKSAKKIMDICRETAAARNIKLSYVDGGIQNNIVWADDLHVNQIIMNILSNAVKYTQPGGKVTFTIAEIASDIPDYGCYKMIVEDTGVGMSKEFVSKIFESFSREESPAASGVEGTGLGMTIVKRLVDYLDGTIDVSSTQGCGTTVTVILHFKFAESLEEISTKFAENIDLNGKKVLLVEDNELNREIATYLLMDHGVQVEPAKNGFEAVEAVKLNGVDYYDCVLMDIQMPIMNGYEATKEIRKLPGADKLIIIALSANAFEEDRKTSLSVGMNDHLAKPINPEVLMQTLGNYMNK